jgi:hypothetical protein
MDDDYLDPLRELRVAKRWALAGIGLAVALLVPTYSMLTGLGLPEILFVVLPAAIAGFLGIELGSSWEYRMRRRFAYPHRLRYQMASIHNFRKAAATGARLVCEWLEARAVIVAWLSEDGRELSAVASHGVPEPWVESAEPISLAAPPFAPPSRRGQRPASCA